MLAVHCTTSREMESDRTWLEQRMLRELQQMSASGEAHEKLHHRHRAERYRKRLRNLMYGDALHHTL